MHHSIFEAGVQPDLGLAAFDELVIGLLVCGHLRKFATEANDVFVALGPVLQDIEILQ